MLRQCLNGKYIQNKHIVGKYNIYYTPAPRRGRWVYCFTSVRLFVRRIWWVQKRYPQYGIPIWCLWPNIRFLPSKVTEKNATKIILDGRKDGWTEGRKDGRTDEQTDRGKTVYPPPPSGSGGIINVIFSDNNFRRIFLSNFWWQKSDIWSQASYRYTILWIAFLDPSDSYFLFADLVGFYTHWTYMHIFRHIFLSNYWWQKSDIWSQASYRYLISWEAFFNTSESYEACDQISDFCHQ
jgi:hypothetical protein